MGFDKPKIDGIMCSLREIRDIISQTNPRQLGVPKHLAGGGLCIRRMAMKANFTPVLDMLVEEFDMLTALVFGKMWRYSQMENHVCSASLERMSQELGISTRTIIRRQKTLEGAGLISRLESPTGDTVKWVVTDIVCESVQLGVGQRVTGGVTESHRGYDRESHKESIKKDINKVSPPAYNSRTWVGVLSEACGMDYSVPRVAGRLAKRGKELSDAGFIPDDISDYFMPAWFEDDWRGQKGQLPTPEQIIEKIGYYKSEYKTAKQRAYESELKAKGYV